MTVYAPTQNGFPFFLTLDRGLSQDARDVRRVQSVSNDASNSLFEFLKMQAIHQISNALALASQDDWDAYQAAPADLGALSYAFTFITQLPSVFPSPDIAIDSDGEIAFDWDYEPRRTFSVRISRDGSLNYAGLLGHTSFHGVEIMRDNIPFRILDGIERVTNNQL
jgi:hypothetical protein